MFRCARGLELAQGVTEIDAGAVFDCLGIGRNSAVCGVRLGGNIPLLSVSPWLVAAKKCVPHPFFKGVAVKLDFKPLILGASVAPSAQEETQQKNECGSHDKAYA